LKVTSVQKGVELRPCYEGASVDQTEARNSNVGIRDQPTTPPGYGETRLFRDPYAFPETA
jgi:hypothetical protein